MLLARVRDDLFDIERPAHSRVELTDTNFELGTQLGERIEALKDFASKLLLRSFRKLCSLRQCQFKCPYHACYCTKSLPERTVKPAELVFPHSIKTC